METDPTRINQRPLDLPLVTMLGSRSPATARSCGSWKPSEPGRCVTAAGALDCERPADAARWGSTDLRAPGDARLAETSLGVSGRAGYWATRQVGCHVRPVSDIAAELGVSWHTAMDTVRFFGDVLIDDPARIGETATVGIDEAQRTRSHVVAQ